MKFEKHVNATYDNEFEDYEKASLSSTEFWNNPIDDEIWNDEETEYLMDKLINDNIIALKNLSK